MKLHAIFCTKQKQQIDKKVTVYINTLGRPSILGFESETKMLRYNHQ